MTMILRRATAVAARHVVGLLLAVATGEWWLALLPIQVFGTVPSQLTDDYNALLTTTLRAMQGRIRDNITRGNRFLAYLKMRGRVRTQSGGERIQVPLMYGLNNTADIYSGYGLIDTTPQDGITSAFFEWAQMAVSITISGREKKQNKGESRLIPLLESKITQAEQSGVELLNNCLVAGRITSSSASGQFLPRRGRLDTSALGPLPLAALIDTNASRSVSIGNINGNTYSWWRNQADSSTASTFAGLKQEMNNIYNDCSKGAGGFPDLVVSGQVAWEEYFNSLQNQERYFVTDKRVVDVLGGMNGADDLLKFRGATHIWDEVCPDTETNAEVVDAVGTHTVDTAFFINSNAYEVVVESDTDWVSTPFLTPVGQDASTSTLLWMGCTAINNRRKLGVLYGISKSIVA